MKNSYTHELQESLFLWGGEVFVLLQIDTEVSVKNDENCFTFKHCLCCTFPTFQQSANFLYEFCVFCNSIEYILLWGVSVIYFGLKKFQREFGDTNIFWQSDIKMVVIKTTFQHTHKYRGTPPANVVEWLSNQTYPTFFLGNCIFLKMLSFTNQLYLQESVLGLVGVCVWREKEIVWPFSTTNWLLVKKKPIFTQQLLTRGPFADETPTSLYFSTHVAAAYVCLVFTKSILDTAHRGRGSKSTSKKYLKPSIEGTSLCCPCNYVAPTIFSTSSFHFGPCEKQWGDPHHWCGEMKSYYSLYCSLLYFLLKKKVKQ